MQRNKALRVPPPPARPPTESSGWRWVLVCGLALASVGCVTASPPLETVPDVPSSSMPAAPPARSSEFVDNSNPSGPSTGSTAAPPGATAAPPTSTDGTPNTSNNDAQSAAPIPSFGAGAELERKAEVGELSPSATAPSVPETPTTAPPSFGEGAELYRGEQGEALPAPPRLRPGPLMPPGAGATSPMASAPLAAPIPPPVRSDALVLLVYQLQTEIYGLRVTLMGRPLLPRMILRIDAISAQAPELVAMTDGQPRHHALARQVLEELTRLQTSARNRDRISVEQSLEQLTELLVKLRTLSVP